MESIDPIEICMSEVMDSLKSALSYLDLEIDTIKLETPPRDLGDLAFSCFSLAKIVKKSPLDIAKEISEKIVLGEHIERLEQKGPYINFFFNLKKLTGMTLKAVLQGKDDYGSSKPKGIKIILEHTSANPTDKLHIGRARNPIIGDTLARVLKKAGFDVETQYYVDDMGKQAVTLAYGIEIWDSKPKDDDSMGPYQYASKMVSEDPKMEAVRNDWLKKLERSDPGITKKVQAACEKVMSEEITSSLSKLDVEVNRYVYESRFVLDGSVDRVISKLKENEFCSDEDGANYIDLEPFTKREAKFFFQRSDGTSLYATRDIAYHLWKFENCDNVINVLGEDHKLESEQVKVGLQIMGLDKFPEVIFYSFVGLPEGKMSTRKGKVIFLDDLITEAEELALGEVKKRREDLSEEEMKDIAAKVAMGSIRYNIVRVQPEKKIIFKWEDALNFEGNSAPFIQYSHARASSILRKADKSDLRNLGDIDYGFLSNPSEIDLIKEIASFSTAIKGCARSRSPHLIAAYAFNLASTFNQFYRDCPVLAVEDNGLKRSRLALVKTSKIVLGNALFCLGISAPEKM
jgi:arginyl-tRNA synthetase